MASGFLSNGVDLDSIFAPYTTGTKPAATGFLVGGVDINGRYAPISQGSAAQVTGFRISGGADLNTLFAAASSTTVTVGTQPGNVSGVASAGDPSGTVTSNTTTCAGSGGTGSYSYTWHIASGSATFTNPNSATTAVTASVGANSTASGTMYCTISDGISSVNTNTVSWSLQNTTIPVSVGTQPANVSGSAAAGYPSGTVTSNSTSCSAANGTGSYSYAWHIASGSGVSFTNPNSATTAVTGSINAASTLSGTMYCTITDSTGGTVNTNTVNWSLQNTSPAQATFSITAANWTTGSGGAQTGWNGYGNGHGSGTGLALPDGHTVAFLADYGIADGYDGTKFSVSGFSADPGKTYFTSIVSNGKTHTPSDSDLTYSYSSGVATWNWQTYESTVDWFGFNAGSNYSVTLNY